MKKSYILFALALAGCTVEQDLMKESAATDAVASQACDACAASEFAVSLEPEAVYTFANGKELLVCGNYEVQDGKKVFSEFVLSECGDKAIVDGWENTERYAVEFAQDTLKLHKLEQLALGSNRELINEVWQTELFYYKGDKLKRNLKQNYSIKYNQSQIEQTLREYESASWLAMETLTEEGEQERMVMANRLFISAISGNEKADGYFKDLDAKLKAEGTPADWYNQLAAMRKVAKKGK